MSQPIASLLIAASLLAVVTPAAHAWEIGYRFGTYGSQFDLLPKNDFEKSTSDQAYYTYDYTRGKMGFNVPMNTLVFVDSSGILLGGMATGANMADARREAREQAARRGAKQGEVLTYSYRQVGAAAGLQTRLSLSWGGSKGVSFESPLTNGPQDLPNATVDLFQFDVRVPVPVYRHELADVAFLMDLYYRSFTVDLAPSSTVGINKMKENQIAMPFGVLAATYPLPNLRLRGVAGYDVVFGLIGLLSSSVAAPIPPSTLLGLGADYAFGNGFELSADAELGSGHVNFNRPLSQNLFRLGASYVF
ncbi:hypothetical protein D3C72_204070 [compost metagenome]